MKQITIELTDTQYKALEYAALSPEDWGINAVTNRARIAIDEIVKLSVEKFIEAGESMPGDKDEIVRIAFERGWVKSAADRNAEAQQQEQP